MFAHKFLASKNQESPPHSFSFWSICVGTRRTNRQTANIKDCAPDTSSVVYIIRLSDCIISPLLVYLWAPLRYIHFYLRTERRLYSLNLLYEPPHSVTQIRTRFLPFCRIRNSANECERVKKRFYCTHMNTAYILDSTVKISVD